MFVTFLKAEEKHLKSGKIRSCGCYFKDVMKEIKSIHGKSGSIEYKIWMGMKKRCHNRNDKKYKNYGGRGIKVCKRWLKFENFYEDMGKKPKGKSLDRVDNNGNYEPNNCRWATSKEQNNNTRRNIFVSVNGVRISFGELAEMFGLKEYKLYLRLFRYNWDLERALIK